MRWDHAYPRTSPDKRRHATLGLAIATCLVAAPATHRATRVSTMGRGQVVQRGGSTERAWDQVVYIPCTGMAAQVADVRRPEDDGPVASPWPAFATVEPGSHGSTPLRPRPQPQQLRSPRQPLRPPL